MDDNYTEEQGYEALKLVEEMEHWLSQKAPYQAPEIFYPNLEEFRVRMKEILE